MKITGKCKAKDLITTITELWNKATEIEKAKDETLDFYCTYVV